MLYDTALRLQRTDLSGPEASEAIEPLRQVLLFFDDHADHEDRFILPHIRKHSPQLLDELEREHEIDHRLTRTLFNHIQAWQAASLASQREAVGQQILLAFSEFIAFNLYHMNKEETVLIGLLWRHYTDGELRQMTQEIIQSIAPQTLMAESRWMMRSINDKELIEWLLGVKQGAPAVVFDAFWQMAEEELPAGRLTNVQAALA